MKFVAVITLVSEDDSPEVNIESSFGNDTAIEAGLFEHAVSHQMAVTMLETVFGRGAVAAAFSGITIQ